MSTEFDKNISDWSYDYTDHKNGIAFFMRLIKWPKIAINKCQNLIFKVNFQYVPKIAWIFLKKDFVDEYQFKSTFSVSNHFWFHQNWTTFVPRISKNFGFFWLLFLAIWQVSEKNQCHFCDQFNHGFNLKCFYQIPLTWWKTYLW